jgi:hypothetical protein
MRITVEAMNVKMRAMGLLLKLAGKFRPMPRFVQPGDTLKQIMITLTGFKDPAHLSVLVRELNNQALQRGIGQMFCVCERNYALLRSLKGFIRVDTAIKHLQQEHLTPSKPVFIDGVDM